MLAECPERSPCYAAVSLDESFVDALPILITVILEHSALSGCFKHCGFTTQEESPDQQSPIDEADNSDGEEVGLLCSQVNSDVSIDDYLNVDD